MVRGELRGRLGPEHAEMCVIVAFIQITRAHYMILSAENDRICILKRLLCSHCTREDRSCKVETGRGSLSYPGIVAWPQFVIISQQLDMERRWIYKIFGKQSASKHEEGDVKSNA